MNDEVNLKEKLLSETSPIPWHELKLFFASGKTILVTPELELVEVAIELIKDNKTRVEQWLQEEKIGAVSDEQAKDWFALESEVLAVIVKPWVLVQAIDEEPDLTN